MKKQIPNSIKITAMILGTIVFLALLSVYLIMWFSPIQTVSASGQATISVTPDIVGIYLMAETYADTLQDAKDDNSKIVSNLKDALAELGIDKDEITTSNYNVGKDYEWTQDGRNFLGYTARHNLRVEVPSNNTELISDIIDAAVDSGAMLNYINFELSPELQNEYKAQSTLLASQDAKGKATNMAKGLGQKLGRIVSVSENNFGYSPWRTFDMAANTLESNDEILETKAIATNIQPGDQDITSTVTVIYKLR